MHWHSTHTKDGKWFWWVFLSNDWTAWVIDDSTLRGVKTEYRIAVSALQVTYFMDTIYQVFDEARVAAVEAAEELNRQPLSRKGRFSKRKKEANHE